jgi:hypothetical protein
MNIKNERFPTLTVIDLRTRNIQTMKVMSYFA